MGHGHKTKTNVCWGKRPFLKRKNGTEFSESFYPFLKKIPKRKIVPYFQDRDIIFQNGNEFSRFIFF